MTLALIFCTIVLAWIYYDLQKETSSVQAILSPIFYFSCLWFIAFPLHALLLTLGWVDTQQNVALFQSDLKAAVWLSLASLIAVYFGCRTARKSHSRANPSYDAESSPHLRRIIIVNFFLTSLGMYFLIATVFKNGEFSPFIGNEQNEVRIGNGPLFILSELFIYGLLATVPALLAPRQRNIVYFLFLFSVALGMIFSIFMGIAISSRRIIVLPVFSFLLAWLYTRQQHRHILAIILLASTVFAAPALQIVRYILAPQPSISTSKNYKEIENYCRYIGNVPSPQRAVSIIDTNGNERELRGLSAWGAKKLCIHTKPVGGYFFIQMTASSFGLVDHLAQYLHNVSFKELLTGVDHGISWSYNFFLALVPRALWDEKPVHYGSVAIQKWLYPYMYSNHLATITLPPSFIVDFLYGFGLPSLFMMSFILGRLLSWVQFGLQLGLQPKNKIRFILSLFFMCSMFNIVRSGTGFFLSLLIVFTVTMLIYGKSISRQIISESTT